VRRVATSVVMVLLAGCSGSGGKTLVRVPGSSTTAVSTTTTVTATSSTTTTRPRPTTTRATVAPGPVLVRYRIEQHTSDAATADFAAVVDATLHDARGWQRAGFVFQRADDAPYTILLAEAPEVQQRCRPYDTYGKYSCQLGPLVALTADRWRVGTPEWTGDLPTYRQELVQHEVGHLLGLHHRVCPGRGRPAPVMAQQSTELNGCLPNPWPLPEEVAFAGRHERPLAPGYEPNAPND